jgi:hypothetical protein
LERVYVRQQQAVVEGSSKKEKARLFKIGDRAALVTEQVLFLLLVFRVWDHTESSAPLAEEQE